MADRNDERLSSRASGGSGAARAERKAAAADVRVERETAAAEQRRLMAEVYDLKTSASQRKKKSDCCCTERYCD